MPKQPYHVTLEYTVWKTVEVQASSTDDAYEQAKNIAEPPQDPTLDNVSLNCGIILDNNGESIYLD